MDHFVLLHCFQFFRSQHLSKKQHPKGNLIIFLILFISSFEIIIIVIPDTKTSFSTAASVADAAAVNNNHGIKTF